MPKGDQYLPLKRFLKMTEKESIILTFCEIERILNFKLPKSAYIYPAWWGNHANNTQATAWLECDYIVENISTTLSNKYVKFIKKNISKSNFDLDYVLKDLFSENRIYCSEAEFQFALAWKIKELYPYVEIKLEFTPFKYNKNMHLDIVVIEHSKMIPIELKYKTKRLYVKSGEEEFQLKDQGAQDIGRYDFIKDIKRLEKLIASNQYPIEKAYAVMLTNCSRYYKSTGNISFDEAFKIHQGKVLKGILSWDERTSKGTKKFREESLSLDGNYTIDWKYATLLGEEFGYLNIQIG
ncbi:Uncharacterised protein [Turicibacter sanguinis]|nr:Uncharacterised protein [Turicibacter sanguinis]